MYHSRVIGAHLESASVNLIRGIDNGNPMANLVTRVTASPQVHCQDLRLHNIFHGEFSISINSRKRIDG